MVTSTFIENLFCKFVTFIAKVGYNYNVRKNGIVRREIIMDRDRRVDLIKKIQQNRNSILISYLTGDRTGIPSAQISGDAIRPMYNHVRALGFAGVEKIDLFLYSRGGSVDAPWPLITMLREYCKELNVLIPFRAHSATTLIALGADSIVMGKKGELGPIDPIMSKTLNEQSAYAETIPVEDVMSYIAFLKERVGLGDQASLSTMSHILADKLSPWTLGSMYRIHSHIRNIARKLLTSHCDSMEEQRISSIIETLAEKTYFHGHAIGRLEAKSIGLNVINATEELDNLMWDLYEQYEQLMKLNEPLDVKIAVGGDNDEYEEEIVMGAIESVQRTDLFTGTYRVKKLRQMPPQMNLTLNFSLPPQIRPDMLPQEVNAVLQNFIQEMQVQLPRFIQAEVNKQAPVTKIQGDLLNGSWKDMTAR